MKSMIIYIWVFCVCKLPTSVDKSYESKSVINIFEKEHIPQETRMWWAAGIAQASGNYPW